MTWHQRNQERLRPIKAANMRRYRADRPEHYAEQSRKAKRRLREKVFAVLGETCAKCAFSDKRALTLDHLLNNGAEERTEIGERGVWLRAIKPEHQHEYRILCMNCQFIARVEAGRQNQHPNPPYIDRTGGFVGELG